MSGPLKAWRREAADTGGPLADPAAVLTLAPSPPRKTAGAAWLLTFTDLVALMLAFFVLLFSMSQIELQKWQGLVETFAIRHDSLAPTAPLAPVFADRPPVIAVVPGSDLDYLTAVLRRQVAVTPVLRGVAVARRQDAIVLSLPGELLFAPNALVPASESAAVFAALAGLLARLENGVEVAGHADPRPAAEPYDSNWELSLARASEVARNLIAQGYARPLLTRGYGDSRFTRSVAAVAQERGLAEARRVDLVIHPWAAAEIGEAWDGGRFLP